MKCPNCKSENEAQILKGYPDMAVISREDIDDGKIILGAVLSERMIPIGEVMNVGMSGGREPKME